MKSEKSFAIETRYENYFDTLAIRVTEPYKYKESIELEEGIILDFDENNFPVALEVLDASKVLKIPKKQYLNEITCVHMNICISDELIKVKLTVEVEINQKETSMTVNSLAINNINAPVMDAFLATA